MNTVITAATNRKLTTVANIRSDLGLAATVTNASIERLIDQASSAIESYCNRIFARETVQQSFPRSNTRQDWLLLSRFPAFTVNSVTSDGEVTDADLYKLDPTGGLLYRLSDEGEQTIWGGCPIVVEFIGGYYLPGDPGYDAAPFIQRLPSVIERAVTMEVAALRNSASLTRDPNLKSHSVEGIGTKTWQVAGGSAGAGSVDTGGFANPALMRMLDPFRVRNV